jgi:signal transduction histidine kinase
VEEATQIIVDEVRHANDIITGLLEYARVRTPNRHPTSILPLIERVLAADWIPDDVRVERRFEVKDDLVREIDADQVQRAISNVVRNAVEAMPEGGELTVALVVDHGDAVITITDTGIGISAQAQKHLFEPLRSNKPLGIGLGLVIARRFVEAHGGRISCLDAAKGASFEIRLP